MSCEIQCAIRTNADRRLSIQDASAQVQDGTKPILLAMRNSKRTDPNSMSNYSQVISPWNNLNQRSIYREDQLTYEPARNWQDCKEAVFLILSQESWPCGWIGLYCRSRAMQCSTTGVYLFLSS